MSQHKELNKNVGKVIRELESIGVLDYPEGESQLISTEKMREIVSKANSSYGDVVVLLGQMLKNKRLSTKQAMVVISQIRSQIFYRKGMIIAVAGNISDPEEIEALIKTLYSADDREEVRDAIAAYYPDMYWECDGKVVTKGRTVFARFLYYLLYLLGE